MNIYTREIATALQISLEAAAQLQYLMECDDFDFSESSTRQLISALIVRIVRDMALFDECCLAAS